MASPKNRRSLDVTIAVGVIIGSGAFLLLTQIGCGKQPVAQLASHKDEERIEDLTVSWVLYVNKQTRSTENISWFSIADDQLKERISDHATAAVRQHSVYKVTNSASRYAR